MRRIALVALIFWTGRAPASDKGRVGFDHNIHDGVVVSRNVEPPACVDCHQLDARRAAPQRPGHAACFKSGCHVQEKSARMCRACHDSEAPKKKARAAYPPYALDPDHALRFSHERHAEAACESCHRMEPKAKRPAPHARCASCHAETEPRMSDCAKCHRAIAGRAVGPALVPGPYRVTFEHRTHAKEPCLTCHAGVAAAKGDDLPPPPMTACEGCHDGQKAFAALGPTCRRCHAQGDRRALPSAAPPQPYRHLAHATRGAPERCDACHSLDAAGLLRAASADHQPCASCHAADFRSSEPKICGGCHVGSEPFRALKADVARNPWTEFGVDFDHRAHATRTRKACADCHGGIAGGSDRRVGRGHVACARAGCHAPDGGPAPQLSACGSCHVAGLLDERAVAKRARRWSVAGRFAHSTHAQTPCADCHDVDAARLAEIRSPGKAACAPCHDGEKAFKMTGHGCARCHGK
jgi:hypothetical protein